MGIDDNEVWINKIRKNIGPLSFNGKPLDNEYDPSRPTGDQIIEMLDKAHYPTGDQIIERLDQL